MRIQNKWNADACKWTIWALGPRTQWHKLLLDSLIARKLEKQTRLSKLLLTLFKCSRILFDDIWNKIKSWLQYLRYKNSE